MKNTVLRVKIILLGLLCVLSCVKHYYISPYEIPYVKKIKVKSVDGVTFVIKYPYIEEQKLCGTLSSDEHIEIDVDSIKTVQMDRISYGGIPVIGSTLAAAVVTALLIDGYEKAPNRPPQQGGECCPLIFSWDGAEYILDAEPFGGSICEGIKRTEYCNLQFIEESDGLYRIRVSNELDETQYIDEIKLVVVEHPKGVSVAPAISGKIHTFTDPIAPVNAHITGGDHIASLIKAHDEVFWRSSMTTEKGEAMQHLRDTLVVEFPRPADAMSVKLLTNIRTTVWGAQMGQVFLKLYGNQLNDWYDEVNNFGPAFDRVLTWYLNEELYVLKVYVETTNGWQVKELMYGSGPLVSDNKVYHLDISDVTGDKLRIMLTPPVNFWAVDYCAVEYSKDVPVDVVEVSASTAITENSVDVISLLGKEDGEYVIMPYKGQYVEMTFAVDPCDDPGFVRSVILKANGYYQIHLDSSGEPQTELIQRIQTEPGYSIQYAMEEYFRQQKYSRK